VKRVPQRELLDHDDGTPDEIAASFADLRRINRLFGGISTTEYLLRSAAQKASLKSADVLEVAAGDGDVVRTASKRVQRSGIDLRITALDRKSSHIKGANGMKVVIGDALALPFDDSSFDFVSCSLFVHHLAPEDAVQFLRESLRVARYAVLINDLRRGAVHLGLVYLGLPLFRSRITWHDGPASVRQAYTPDELRDLIAQAGASHFEISPHYLYRMAATIWK
jgi:ubiquinone/menaquinone biosynthesis C-methylase UbiE